jgi:hypothetical protein
MDRDMEFSFTVLRNGVEIVENGTVGEYDNGVFEPDIWDVIWAVQSKSNKAGDILNCVQIDGSCYFYDTHDNKDVLVAVS